MAAYWIARVEVSNPDVYREYARRAGPAIESHGGRFLARGGECVHLEGRHMARNVVIEFDSVESAQACYHSPEYQEALAFALRSSTRDVVIVEGV